MNEIYHIALLVGIELIGLIFLSIFKVESKLNIWLGFVTGLFVINQTFLFSLFLLDHVNDIVFLLLALLALAAFYFNKSRILAQLTTGSVRTDVLIMLGFMTLVVLKPNYIGITSDSVHYYIASEAINNNFLTGDMLQKFSWFFANARLIFLDMLIVLGLVLDADLIVYILPLIGFISLMFIFRIIAINFDLNQTQKFFLLLSIVLFSLSVDRFLSHTHYLHSNLITGVYYLFGVVMLMPSEENKREYMAPWLGILFLSVTVLIRKEMLLFSLIPVMLYLLLNKQNFSVLVRHVLLYLLVSYQWIAYYLWKVGEIDLNLNDLFYSGHGTAQDYLFAFITTVVLTIVALSTNNFLRKTTVNVLLYFSYLAFLLVLFAVDFNETMETIVKLLNYSILNINAWGFYWVVLFLSLIYSYKNGINGYLSHIVLSFVIVRIGIYVLYDTITDYGGGDRMMLLIFFIGMYIIFHSVQHNLNSGSVVKK